MKNTFNSLLIQRKQHNLNYNGNHTNIYNLGIIAHTYNHQKKKKKERKKEEGLIENDEGINLCVQNGSVKLELRD